MAVFLAAVLLRLHKIVIIQAVCGLLLLTFLAIVFGSTVFTRTPRIRQYQPEVFWSWKEILGIGKCGRLGTTTGDGLLQENLLNILLLFPSGILLPGLIGRKLKWWMGLLVGIAISGRSRSKLNSFCEAFWKPSLLSAGAAFICAPIYCLHWHEDSS